MANEEHLTILRQGVEVWNRWREKNPQVKPDTSAADLTNADLRGFNLSNVLLAQANLCKANLSGADLRNADLTDAYFGMTNFSNADLSGAFLVNVDHKGNGILVVRVAVAPDADKAKIHSDFMQGYEFANKALEAQYQARLEDKDTLFSKQEAQINRLFDIVEQQGSVQKALAENPRKVSNYDQRFSQFGGGNVDAETVNAEQLGGSIHNKDA